MTETSNAPEAGRADAPAARDYKDTLFLPKTDFPMRAGLPKKEPELLARWAEMGLYQRNLEEARAQGRPRFILHDGPPYANNNIHIGTALNKILKDFVARSKRMAGYRAPYRPGWDCHGLPIEWEVERAFRKQGRAKEDVPGAEFRAACRAFAQDWIEVQSAEFQRLGVAGDWEDPYTTMTFEAEATIVSEFLKFVDQDLVYRGSSPVMWSPVEQTALAEAEVEYQDKQSSTIYASFPVRATRQDGSPAPEALAGASVVIWTTTPWTIPGNKAICYSPEVSYGVYEVIAADTGKDFAPWAKPGERVVLADALAEETAKAGFITEWTRLGDVDPAGLLCDHPFAGLDPYWGYPVPLFEGEHVTDEQGTGFVHTAPGHGAEDYIVWMRHKAWHDPKEPIPYTVGPDGAYLAHIPAFAGLEIVRREGKKQGQDGPANKAIIDALIDQDRLLARGRLTHSYPHSWRSKAPVIFRNTDQWFIAIDKPMADGTSLREKALRAIAETQWTPAASQNRIRSMVQGRPDWLISRQRAWGVPLTLFVHKETGAILKDAAVNARILAAVRAGGAGAWFDTPAEDLLGPDYDPDAYERLSDILDVWFDSGCTHAFVLAEDEWPADLYLEGSDQHRGWFQASLLQGCGTRGRAPYNAAVTHGFTMDGEGRKMSKSLGNVVHPGEVAKTYGVEILRLWVAASDYTGDQRISDAILESIVDAYRKLRNTVRYLVGAVHGFSDTERLARAEMPALERFLLHRLAELDAEVRAAYDVYDFKRVWNRILTFCVNDLSAFYLDIRKDSLYCDKPDAPRRWAARTVMAESLDRLLAWLAPLAPFTTEEAFLERHGGEGSVHLTGFLETPAAWRDDARAADWAVIRRLRRVVTGALEVERREKRIGSSLEAGPDVYAADPAYRDALARQTENDPADTVDALLADVCITSAARLIDGPPPADAFTLDEVPGAGAVVKPAAGQRCARSWRIRPDVGSDPRYRDLSARDAEAVAAWDARHKAA